MASSIQKLVTLLVFLLLPTLSTPAKIHTFTSSSFVTRGRTNVGGKLKSASMTINSGPSRPVQSKTMSQRRLTSQLAVSRGGAGMSTRASAVSLTKNIIGAGILALPAGMAAGAGTGQITATLMAVMCCVLST
jgi:hypothetical protein